MKKIAKHLMASILGVTLMLTTIVPSIHAEENAPEISFWAIETLNEGEKYGIFPMDWYYEGFRSEATVGNLEELLALTEQKIAALELPENKQYSPQTYENDATRGSIVTRLYDIVARYDLPVGNDAIDYMTERNILVGDGKGLALEKKVTTEEAVVFAVRFIKDTYHLAGQGSKGVAWVVEDEDTLVYLLGSIHLGTPDLYPFNEKLLSAFEESDALLVEANVLDPLGMQYYAEKAMFTDGTTIEDVVSTETYEKLKKVAEQYQLPLEQIALQKPWTLSSSLSMLAMDDSFGLTPEQMSMHGIDMYFLLNALLQGKPIIELEGTAAQVDMLAGLSAEAQEQSLVKVLDSILEPTGESEADFMKDWFNSWKNEDINEFEKSLKAMEGEPSEFNSMLFGERDIQMAKKIQALLKDKEGTFFVVVGAGHFLVDKNIIYHLEQNGITVKPFYQ
ncbi:TraB/GumN family protein [Ureibacillus manganicus]|uniref:Conjugal transfer protein TraB n=1 Tax=Ureibacillus manganicus DSM 26584 TaxID=1384049 RepID=A0A0A3HYF6_9BACL|nr:TraB/GumN family protein [Ureibacillus manganicus]KGR77641.1 conjugal transfer protein TraB [Ureibacillus manganicus DSM 26584]